MQCPPCQFRLSRRFRLFRLFRLPRLILLLLPALLLLLVLLLLAASPVRAQLTGRLRSPESQPIPAATISLLSAGDSTALGTVRSDSLGIYHYPYLPERSFRIRITAIGFQTWDSLLAPSPDRARVLDLGTLILARRENSLQEVLVTAQRPMTRQESFGTVVNVSASILSKGSTVLELLERSPGVSIDRRYNNIALDGKPGVLVMIDGKPMRMSTDQVVTLLKVMNGDDIDRIELMNTPPANFDAEGGGGMINIVLKKERRPGTNGSLTLTQGYGWGEKEIAGLNLAHNGKLTNIYGAYSFSHDRSFNSLVGNSYQDFPFLGGPQYVWFQNQSRLVQNDHDARLGIDLHTGSRTTIGASISFGSQHGRSSDNNQRVFTILPDSVLNFSGHIGADNRWTSLVNSLYLEQRFRPGEKLNLDLDYLYYTNDAPTDAQSNFVNQYGAPAGTNNDTLFAPHQQGYSHTGIRIGVGKLDYERQLRPGLRVQTGIKGSYTQSKSSSAIQSLIDSQWISRPETSSDMIMKESIGAGYATLNWQLNGVLGLNAGLRYEYAHTRLDDLPAGSVLNNGNGANGGDNSTPIVDRKLGAFFPDIFLTARVNDHSDWQLSFTRRISRPAYNDLSSFVSYNDPVSVFTGNPLLRPTLTSNIRLAYHYRRYGFSLLLSQDRDPIARYQITASASGNLQYISPQNMDYLRTLNVQADLPWKINGWWNMNYSLIAGWRQFRESYTPLPAGTTYFAYNLHGSQTFSLPADIAIELSGWYNSASYEGNVRNDGVGSLDLGIRKQLKKDRGSFQLAFTDILQTQRYGNHYGSLTPDYFAGRSSLVYRPESTHSQMVRLTYTRHLGGGGGRSAGNPEPGASDEQQRVRK